MKAIRSGEVEIGGRMFFRMHTDEWWRAVEIIGGLMHAKWQANVVPVENYIGHGQWRRAADDEWDEANQDSMGRLFRREAIDGPTNH